MRYEKLYGLHPVSEALGSRRRRIHKILLDARRRGAEIERIIAAAAERGIPVESVASAALHRMLGHQQHQGVVALALPLEQPAFPEFLSTLAAETAPQTLVLLDGVTDSGNFAALLRSAVAFGVAAVLLPRHRSVSLTPAVVKRSAGAADRLAVVHVGNVVQALGALQEIGFWIYGAEMRAPTTVGEMRWPARVVLVLGGEEHGMRRLVREQCDGLISVPMRADVDSLNVTVAGAIILAYIWDDRRRAARVSGAENSRAIH